MIHILFSSKNVNVCLVLFFVLVSFAGCRNSVKTNIAVYSTSQDGDKILRKADISFSKHSFNSIPAIKVDETIRFQKIEGFGATFNEAGMICLNSLQEKDRNQVLQMLFDPDSGAGFTAMKSPIGACDFSSAGTFYSYCEIPGDTLMEHFSIIRDLEPNGQISFIKSASRYGKFKIETCMDFAPDWMYHSLNKGDRIIKPIYKAALCRYYIKFLQSYAENGITVDYINLFNEPGVYSDVSFSFIGEIIKDYLGPELLKSGLITKIQLGEESSRANALKKFPGVLRDLGIRKYISSLSFHAYDWGQSALLTKLHKDYPDLPLWQTETCYARVGDPIIWTNIPTGRSQEIPVYGISDGEFWGNIITDDLNNWTSAWIYWNMILDQDGGPCLVSPVHDDPPLNRQHAVVIINRDTKKVSYTGLYYYLSHFSRFIRPDAYRINCAGGNKELNFIGFINPDGSIILNIINNADETNCAINWQDKSAIQLLKAHSITTLKWNVNQIP